MAGNNAKTRWHKVEKEFQDHPEYDHTLKGIFNRGMDYIHHHGEQMWFFGFISGAITASIILISSKILFGE